MARRRRGIPPLPQLLQRKIYKTGQTRGADDDVIYQNRVARNSTVLIPYRSWRAGVPAPPDGAYVNGYIVLISPTEYVALGATDAERAAALTAQGIPLGERSLVFYERRADWNTYPPGNFGWTVATSRIAPLGGQYVARVANTTSAGDERVNHGFTTNASKGAGVRVYEYASTETIELSRAQLEAIFWHADDAVDACAEFGMPREDAEARRDHALSAANDLGLLDKARLRSIRAINEADKLTCPLCLDELSA